MPKVAKSSSHLFITFSAGLGMFMSSLDAGIVNIALPTLQREFDTKIYVVSWLITIYVLMISSTIVIFGRLSDRYGRVKFYLSGIVVFTLASLLCGFAHSIKTLIFFRALQGIGAAMIQATAIALITTLVQEKKREKALGLLSVMMALGPAIGPTMGGVIMYFIDWRWIFWINLPIGITAFIAASRLPRIIVPKMVSLNALGVSLFSLAIFLLVWAISILPEIGIRNMEVLLLFLGAIVSLIFFIVQEKNTADPFIDFHLFRQAKFLAHIINTVAVGIVTNLIYMVIPFFLNFLKNYTPLQAGLVLFFFAFAIMLAAPISQKIRKQSIQRIIIVFGLLMMLTTLIILTLVNENCTAISLALILFINGFGTGLILVPNLSAIMGAVQEERQGSISAFNRMVRNAVGALAVAVAAAFLGIYTLGSHMIHVLGFREVWLFGSSVILIALLTYVRYLIVEHKKFSLDRS